MMSTQLLPCLICKNRLDTATSLLTERTKCSRTLFITSLSKIIKRRLNAALLRQTDVCGTCHSLLNLIDEHESKRLAYENEVRLKFKLPFPIVLEQKSDVPVGADNESIVDDDLTVSANGSEQAGPDDVIVSADENGLVTVTYGESVAGMQVPTERGRSSPSGLLDGDAGQQVVIFKAGDPSVTHILQSLIHSPASGSVPQPLLTHASIPTASTSSSSKQSLPRQAPIVTNSDVSKEWQPPSARKPTGSRSKWELPMTFHCDSCDAVFDSTTELAEHRTSHRPRLKCRFCGRGFSSTRVLNLHHNRAHWHQLLPCQSCDKRFSTSRLLHQHRNVHRMKEFSCLQCQQFFCTWHDLKLHITFKHSDARPFACEVCGRTFKTASLLKRHRAKHTGLVGSSCTQCGQTFVFKSSLEKHAAGHRRERFVCDTCSKTFSQRGKLVLHARKQHGDATPVKQPPLGKDSRVSGKVLRPPREELRPPEENDLCPSELLEDPLQRVLTVADLDEIVIQDLVGITES